MAMPAIVGRMAESSHSKPPLLHPGDGDRPGSGDPGVDLFTAVSPSRVSQTIAAQIRGLIQEGRLRVGDRLPSERELCAKFAVSRVTVREAFRILEAVGLVTIKVGASGGAFVTSPTSDQVGDSLADMVAVSTMSAEEVTEARTVLELGIIPLVCGRATEEDIADLRAMVAEHRSAVEREQYTPAMSVAFHIRVASCAHNEAISMLARALHQPMLDAIRTARTIALREGRGRKAIADYERLVEAIAEHDAAAADAIMRTLLARSEDRLRMRRELLDQDAASFDAIGYVPTID